MSQPISVQDTGSSDVLVFSEGIMKFPNEVTCEEGGSIYFRLQISISDDKESR
mgnify:CR=1 FL=1